VAEEFEARRRDQKRRYRDAQERKIRGFAQARVRLAEDDLRRKREKMTSDAAIAERLRRCEEVLALRSENARLQISDQAVRAIVRNHAWRAAQEKKAREMRRESEEREEYIPGVLARKRHGRRKVSIRRRLEEEEKAQSARGIDRQRERSVSV
jgi:hypothetical protein